MHAEVIADEDGLMEQYRGAFVQFNRSISPHSAEVNAASLPPTLIISPLTA